MDMFVRQLNNAKEEICVQRRQHVFRDFPLQSCHHKHINTYILKAGNYCKPTLLTIFYI